MGRGRRDAGISRGCQGGCRRALLRRKAMPLQIALAVLKASGEITFIGGGGTAAGRPSCIRGGAQCLRPDSIPSRLCSAREAPMAVSTFLTFSGGGNTAGMPSDWIHSSRPQPIVG